MLKGSSTAEIKNWKNNVLKHKKDQLAIEQPLQIRLAYQHVNKVINTELVITMRTPGNDKALAVGYLFAEGIIESNDDLSFIDHTEEDVITVGINKPLKKSAKELSRTDISTGACGMCGKTNLEAIHLPQKYILPESPFSFKAENILGFPEKLSRHQKLFEQTGGIHASAFFNEEGMLVSMFEDIGRHNSLDKLIGHRLLQKDDELSTYTLFVSGRAGFELIQKALVANIKLLVSVGAPSSLAVQYAQEYGMSLVGFLKNDSFNIYTHPQRIQSDQQE